MDSSLMFLVAGYAVFWIISFVFIYSMVNRQQKLEKEVDVLAQLIQESNE